MSRQTPCYTSVLELVPKLKAWPTMYDQWIQINCGGVVVKIKSLQDL